MPYFYVNDIPRAPTTFNYLPSKYWSSIFPLNSFRTFSSSLFNSFGIAVGQVRTPLTGIAKANADKVIKLSRDKRNIRSLITTTNMIECIFLKSWAHTTPLTKASSSKPTTSKPTTLKKASRKGKGKDVVTDEGSKYIIIYFRVVHIVCIYSHCFYHLYLCSLLFFHTLRCCHVYFFKYVKENSRSSFCGWWWGNHWDAPSPRLERDCDKGAPSLGHACQRYQRP